MRSAHLLYDRYVDNCSLSKVKELCDLSLNIVQEANIDDDTVLESGVNLLGNPKFKHISPNVRQMIKVRYGYDCKEVETSYVRINMTSKSMFVYGNEYKRFVKRQQCYVSFLYDNSIQFGRVEYFLNVTRTEVLNLAIITLFGKRHQIC